MSTIALIVAASENNAIGYKNDLLWHLPADMKFFKNTTWGLPVIMGRKSYDGIGHALQGRANYVVSAQAGFTLPDATVCNTLPQALALAETQMQANELMVIGGGQIYALALPLAHRIYLTRVHANFELADAFFPALDPLQWQLVKSNPFLADQKHAYNYTFELWERRANADGNTTA
ncbi:MAG: dihydrofolate reductase [Bacteroidetes bacterium]|nr:MAG: dihydrofolate reductase [Bacteroidota bacterium]